MPGGRGPCGGGDCGVGLYGVDETSQFRAGPVRTAVELRLGGTWTDITPLVYTRGAIQISRGRQDEGSTVDASRAKFLVNNRDGAFSPRNPTSPYYGQLGRNTQCRISVGYGQSFMGSSGAKIGGATTPASAAADVVGDIDLRFDAWMENWSSSDLITKYGSAGQRSYLLYMASDQLLRLDWSADRTTLLHAVSTVPVPWPRTGRMAVRATLDVDNGAAGNTTTFYWSDTIDGTCTQIGDPVVKAGTTSIFN